MYPGHRTEGAQALPRNDAVNRKVGGWHQPSVTAAYAGLVRRLSVAFTAGSTAVLTRAALSESTRIAHITWVQRINGMPHSHETYLTNTMSNNFHDIYSVSLKPGYLGRPDAERTARVFHDDYRPQGGPLSPALFLLAMDPLLHALVRRHQVLERYIR